MKKKTKTILQAPHVWTFTTYFAEGFPYTIIRMISSVFFRDMRVSLEAIGLTSLFGLPWVLKFLWGPQIDEYGTKRRWMLSMQFLLILMTGSVALLSALPGGIRPIAFLLLAGAFIAATHDMAIDGYYMEGLDEKGQAKFVGYRVMAYRIAMMTGTGIIVTVGAAVNWLVGYLSAAALLAALFLYHLLLLPSVEEEKVPIRRLVGKFIGWRPLLVVAVLVAAGLVLRRSFPWRDPSGNPLAVITERIGPAGLAGIGLLLVLIAFALFKDRIKGILLKDRNSFYSRAFIAYMDRDGISLALAFIILMRTGESMLASMASPFMVDLGMKIHYGWISGGVGLPFSIAGAMAGGWMISKYSLKNTIWPFLLAQNFTNLIYMFLALYLQKYILLNTAAGVVTPVGNFNLFLVAAVHAFDQFSGGLGTSVLVTFLMRTCLPEFKAAHFAIGTGLMNVSGVVSGVISGFLAGWVGYGYFFGISFLASIPGMMLIFFVPFLEGETRKEM